MATIVAQITRPRGSVRAVSAIRNVRREVEATKEDAPYLREYRIVSHSINFLRSLAEDVDKPLIEAWPSEQPLDKRRFETLKGAYVEARYSDQYGISAEDLDALSDCAHLLGDLVVQACEARIADA